MFEAPKEMYQTGFHCWRHTECLMPAAEVIPRDEQRDSRFQVSKGLTESIREARKPTQVHPRAQIEAFDMAGTHARQIRIASDILASSGASPLPQNAPGHTTLSGCHRAHSHAACARSSQPKPVRRETSDRT